jgi:hypothetical protein
MRSLRRLLTSHSCTVVCTLSQPSTEILEYVDNYLFLVDGVTVFNGSLHQLTDMVSVLKQTQFEVSPDAVFAFMDVLYGDKDVRGTVMREWYERRNISLLLLKQAAMVPQQQTGEAVDTTATEPLSIIRERRQSVLHQVYILAVRHLLHQYRATNGMFTTFLLHIIAGAVVGVLYYNNIKYLEDLVYLANPFTAVFESYTLNVIGWHMACPLMIVLARAIPIPVIFYTKEIYDREQVRCLILLSQLLSTYTNMCNLIYLYTAQSPIFANRSLHSHQSYRHPSRHHDVLFFPRHCATHDGRPWKCRSHVGHFHLCCHSSSRSSFGLRSHHLFSHARILHVWFFDNSSCDSSWVLCNARRNFGMASTTHKRLIYTLDHRSANAKHVH